MITPQKRDEARSMLSLYGEAEAASRMGISIESLHRYARGDENKPKPVRVLLLDIETAPGSGYFWSPWKTDIQPNQIINDWFMLGWSAKELFDNNTFSDIVTPEEARKRDDKRIVSSLWEEVNGSDIIIGHNLRKFDMPMSNTRFLIHGFPSPLPYRIVDTREILKKNFRFAHNKLDYVNRALGLGRKLETGGFDLWNECMAGEQKALALMQKYNKNDIGILEELYVAIRGWAKSHPSMGQYVEGNGVICPTCGGTNLSYGGFYYADVNRYRAYRCDDCGAICRAPSGSKKTNLLRSIAR